MQDYKQKILGLMRFYRGIIKDDRIVDLMNDTINKLDLSSIPGAHKLVNNFLSSEAESNLNNDPSKAYDYWLELYIIVKLMEDKRISNLAYEPNECSNPPDFRFNVENVCYDLEVKHIRPYEAKRLFEEEIGNLLPRIPKPWFLNYCLSDKIENFHKEAFMSYLLPKIDEFKTDIYYYWPQRKNYIVEFSFSKKGNSSNLSMSLGTIRLSCFRRKWTNGLRELDSNPHLNLEGGSPNEKRTSSFFPQRKSCCFASPFPRKCPHF